MGVRAAFSLGHPNDGTGLPVSNLTQLQVLAARTTTHDENIFIQTLEYLEDPAARFHLVLDELHLYRGSSGTETAFSLRIILNRLRLLPGQEFHSRLRILASSASLDGGDEATFLTQFFGVPFETNEATGEPGFYIERGALADIGGQDPSVDALALTHLPIESDPFIEFAQSDGGTRLLTPSQTISTAKGKRSGLVCSICWNTGFTTR